MARVKLQAVVEALEFSSDAWRSFLNRETGEIVTLTDDGIIADDEGLDEEALDAGPFLPLPGKSELDEWSMMQRFALERNEHHREHHREELLDAIRGRGAFRMFKSTIRRLGIEADWFRFRDAAFEEFARDWLVDNGIAYDS
jgi:hypothetical protein